MQYALRTHTSVTNHVMISVTIGLNNSASRADLSRTLFDTILTSTGIRSYSVLQDEFDTFLQSLSVGKTIMVDVGNDEHGVPETLWSSYAHFDGDTVCFFDQHKIERVRTRRIAPTAYRPKHRVLS